VRPASRWEKLYSADRLPTFGMSVNLKDFYADWCGPCKTQDPILEEVEEEYPDVSFEKVNVDEEQDVANEYQVRSLPTLVIENDDGIVQRFVGVTQRDDIEDALQEAGA
jgi:thioredoxin 1